jgi:four helix bundle protein
MNSFERLEAWQAAHELARSIYRTTRSFPVDERYGLSSQLRRAAFSIPANIAEGSAKRGAREFARHLNIAVGSMAELTYGLRLVRDLQLVSENMWNDLEGTRDRVSRLTWRLYTSMRRASTHQR